MMDEKLQFMRHVKGDFLILQLAGIDTVWC